MDFNEHLLPPEHAAHKTAGRRGGVRANGGNTGKKCMEPMTSHQSDVNADHKNIIFQSFS